MSILRMLPNYMLAVLLLIFGRIVALLFIRIRVEGVENVPHQGPLIVTANHFSWFDAPLLTLYLPDRQDNVEELNVCVPVGMDNGVR